MAKRRKTKGRTRPQKRVTSSGLTPVARPVEFVEMSNPVGQLSPSERGEVMQELADVAEAEFSKHMATLDEVIGESDPVQLISALGLQALLAQQKTEFELTSDTLLADQYELIHALILRKAKRDFGGKFMDGRRLSEIQDAAAGATSAFSQRRMGALAAVSSDGEARRLFVIEQMRGATQRIRNWGYPEQMIRILHELFAPLDDAFTHRFGLSATGILDMMIDVMSLIEDRLAEYRARLYPVFKAKTLTALAKRYFGAFPDIDGSPDRMVQSFRERGATPGQARAILLEHASLRLPGAFTITMNDFIDAYPSADVDRKAVTSIVDRWALSFGDLGSIDQEHLFLGNPIWGKPLIALGNERFLLPNAVQFFSFCLEMFDELLADDPTLREQYERRRAKYLEDRLYDLLIAAFPTAKVHRGSLWKDDASGKDFENDLLVVVDEVALVIEAKSGRVSAPARRGAVRRLEREIQKLVAEPAQQAARFIGYLKRVGPHVELQTLDGRTNKINLSDVKQLIPISIIFENLGSLATHGPTLRAAGFVASDAPLAPTIGLTDLEIIFETLGRACEKLHYLKRRSEFENHVLYEGDEVDLLGFYLETGFNIGETEYQGELALHLTGISAQQVDPYFMRGGRLSRVARPQRRYTKFWSDLLDRVELRKWPHWTLVGFTLLNVAESDQVKFERGLQKVIASVRPRSKKPGQKNYVVLANGPPQRRDVLVGAAYKTQPRDERDKFLQMVAGSSMDIAGSDQAVVIGVDVEELVYPYNTIGLFFRTPRSTDG